MILYGLHRNLALAGDRERDATLAERASKGRPLTWMHFWRKLIANFLQLLLSFVVVHGTESITLHSLLSSDV